jgi:hypothetical protein
MAIPIIARTRLTKSFLGDIAEDLHERPPPSLDVHHKAELPLNLRRKYVGGPALPLFVEDRAEN